MKILWFANCNLNLKSKLNESWFNYNDHVVGIICSKTIAKAARRTSTTNKQKTEGDVKCATDLLELLEVSSVIDLAFFNLRLEIPM